MALEEIPLIDITPNPSQPRQRFDQEAFAELVASVGKHGVVQPVLVRQKDDCYELIAGERRWRAAKEAGLTTIPAVVKTSDDGESFQLALIENIQREDLNALEEAMAYRRLTDEFNFTQVELAEIVGKNRATVANTMRLLQLSGPVKQLVSEERLSSGHARALLMLDQDEDQEKLAARVVGEGLSVRQTEELAKIWQLSKDKEPVKKPALPPEIRTVARRIGRFLGTRVKTKLVNNKIKLEIELTSAEELNRIAEIISGGQVDLPR